MSGAPAKEPETQEKRKTSAGSVILLILIYFVIYLVCSAMFVGLFHTELFRNVNVLMYRGLIFVFLTGLVAAMVMGVVKRFWTFVTVRDIIMMFMVFCCVNTVVLTLVPVTIERSVSVFMLSYMDEIPVCTKYILDGQETDRFPFPAALGACKPVIEKVKGWKKDISGVRTWEDLPEEAKAYVQLIERAIKCPIRWVSVGPERESIIIRG